MIKVNSPDGSSSFVIGNNESLCLIAGPCVIESREMLLRHAEAAIKITSKFNNISLVFKSSFDKANRTSLKGYRGLGIDEGLKILQEVRTEFNVPVITDVHTPEDASLVSEVVDIMQIPAFLCRQTDLLIAVGACSKPVLIKKGQFLHPSDMKFAADKVKSSGNNEILLCERGTCFGYRDLVVDFRSFSIMKDLGYPVVFDATHSVQSMGGAGGSSSGNRTYAPLLSIAAISYGIDALFIECHEDPDSAPSDGPNMINFNSLKELCHKVSALWNLSQSF